MNFSRKLVFTATLSLMAVNAWCVEESPTAGGLSLAKAALVAIERSPILKQIAAGSDIASAMADEARAAKYPYVEASTSFMWSNNPVFVFGSLLEQERFSADRFQIDKLNSPSPQSNNRTMVNAMVPIFDGFQADVRISRASFGVEESSKRKELAEQALRMEVVRVYFGVLLAEERVRVARESVWSAEADLKRISDMSEVGMLVRSDLLAVEVQLAEFRQAVIEAETEAEIAYAGLNSLLGEPVTERPNLTGTLAEKKFDLPEPPDATGAALRNRPELAMGDLKLRSADEAVRGAKNQYLPRVDLFGSYGASAEVIGADSTDWTVGVKVSLPVFDAGRSARLSQATASTVAARASRKADEDRVALDAVSSYKRFKAMREKLAVAAGAVSQAAEAHRMVQDRHQVGLTTITEVLRAQNALLSAKLGELMARYNVYVGYADFLRATGNLRDVEAF